jgi:hypothetical protein
MCTFRDEAESSRFALLSLTRYAIVKLMENGWIAHRIAPLHPLNKDDKAALFGLMNL